MSTRIANDLRGSNSQSHTWSLFCYSLSEGLRDDNVGYFMLMGVISPNKIGKKGYAKDYK
jgi:hypothetical protein